MSETSATRVDVAIIGAGKLKIKPRKRRASASVHRLTRITGWYGLVTARTYLRVRPDIKLLILDSDSSVGGVWSEKRLYPNLVAQVKLGVSSAMQRRPALSPLGGVICTAVLTYDAVVQLL